MLSTIEGFDTWQPSGKAAPDLFERVRKHGITYSQEVTLHTDSFRPDISRKKDPIHYRGVNLLPNRNGVLVIEWWPGGGMEVQFRSMRTAKAYVKTLPIAISFAKRWMKK